MATKRRPLAGVSAASLARLLFTDKMLARLLGLHVIFLAPLLVGDVLPTVVFRALEVAVTGTTVLLVLIVAGQLVNCRRESDREETDA